MVTIFTEDGRTLQYQDYDFLTVVGLATYSRPSGRLLVKNGRASEIEVGDYLWVQGKGRLAERDPDLARVREISR